MKEHTMAPVDETDEDYLDDLEEREATAKGQGVDVILVPISKRASELQSGQADAESQEQDIWGDQDILPTVYSPLGLIWLYRNASSLRQNIEAMAHNVDGFGWKPKAVFDFESEDVRQQIATALYLHEYAQWELACADANEEKKDLPASPTMPSKDEVEVAFASWKQESAIEKERLMLAMENACFESSFSELRTKTTTDKETIGWGVWEIIRLGGTRGVPKRFIHVRAETIRLRPLMAPKLVEEFVPTSRCSYMTVKVWRRFRTYVQIETDGTENGDVRFFREFGDPGIYSSRSGMPYKSMDDLRKAEGEDAAPANELLIFSGYFPGSAYGAPRFHGVIPEIKGAWLAAQHVVDYLENSAIPRGMLLINDGRLNKKSVGEVKNFFGTAKGRAENRIAVIQAETPRDRAFEPGGRVKMEFVDLTNAQREDAEFMQYDQRVDDKVGESFRQPPIMRGRTKDFNRATADAAMQFTEEQVYRPERQTFDWTVNTKLLRAMGIRFWLFASKSPVKQDPEILVKIIEILLKYGVVVPAEVRSTAEQMLGVDLLRIAGDWQYLPLALIQQGFTAPKQTPLTVPSDPNPASSQGDAEEKKELVMSELAKYREMVGEDRFDSVMATFRAAVETDRAATE